MSYVMPAEMYWNYIEEKKLTHIELIAYLNRVLDLLEPIRELHIWEG